MIKVEHLTKKFANCTAVDDISFEVERGEIVGLLGPNGAGKTTTMRVLTGYHPASAGHVSVAGFDIFSRSMDVRRHIGYLPESVPLYPELRVDEYLRFRARLKQVRGRNVRRRVNEVKELCGLKDMGRRIIGQMSKGYRQRVGLAEALVNDPDLLILDEPTIGLDPNQIRQVRELIKSLSDRHTILLSTHILPEVEMTCGRVLILNKGKIVASDEPGQLRHLLKGGASIIVELQANRDDIERTLSTLPEISQVKVVEQGSGWSRAQIECLKDEDIRASVFELAVRNNWKLRELRMENKSLEDIFISLTQGEGGDT